MPGYRKPWVLTGTYSFIVLVATGPKSRQQQGCTSSTGSRGEPFLASPNFQGPAAFLMAAWLWSLHRLPRFSLCFPPIRTLIVGLKARTDNLDELISRAITELSLQMLFFQIRSYSQSGPVFWRGPLFSPLHACLWLVAVATFLGEEQSWVVAWPDSRPTKSKMSTI